MPALPNMVEAAPPTAVAAVPTAAPIAELPTAAPIAATPVMVVI
jgi:hypothetical protein